MPSDRPVFVQDVTDSGARIAPLDSICFLGRLSTVTITGCFVNSEGVRTGTYFTYTIPLGDGTNNPVTFATIYAATLPADAVGARVFLSSSVYWDAMPWTETVSTSDFKTNYALAMIEPGTATYTTFGRAN